RADEVQKLNYFTISPEALVGEPSVLFHPISRRLMESCCSSLKASPLSSHQGFRSAIGRTSSRIPSLYKPFVQLDHRRNSVRFGPGTVRRGIVLAEAKNQGWDLGRFVKTFYFFNSPPSPAKFIQSLIERVSSPSPSESDKRMETSEVVLVVGATGGVGKRVVDILQKKGIPVRALVRNEEKAKRLLGPDVDLIVGDITKVSTLDPELFKGVRKVINAASVIVGPKEGDTPERAKYSQGIKFFEPEIKGDSPEMVEYNGMKNLISAVKGTVGLRSGKLLFGCEGVQHS
ncbi:hypothetical protein LINPERPRIM_LOCUS18378, partial [Linum perenne]